MSTHRVRAVVAGLSVPELIVALILGLFVVHLGLSSVARLRGAEARLAARRDGLVAMRVTRHVLRTELRHGLPGRDWAVEEDSIGLRAFRGTALVCPADGAGDELTVSFSGIRRPDPTKDSVLFLGAQGRVEVRALRGVGGAATGCGPTPAASLDRWTVDAPVEPGAVVGRLFERGSYHLALSALRYRRGESGRQPLTPEVMGAGTAWVGGGERLGIEVEHDEVGMGTDWSAFLAWARGP